MHPNVTFGGVGAGGFGRDAEAPCARAGECARFAGPMRRAQAGDVDRSILVGAVKQHRAGRWRLGQSTLVPLAGMYTSVGWYATPVPDATVDERKNVKIRSNVFANTSIKPFCCVA